MRRSPEEYRGRLEDDSKPLDRLVGKGAQRRQIRLYVEPTDGKTGLLMAVKPQTPKLEDDHVQIVGHHELLPTYVEIAPGMSFRPRVSVEVVIELTPQQMAEYRRYVTSMKMPETPIAP